MKDSELYTSSELELFEQIENGEYVSLGKEEFEKKKVLLRQATLDINSDLKIFEERKNEETIYFKSYSKTFKEM